MPTIAIAANAPAAGRMRHPNHADSPTIVAPDRPLRGAPAAESAPNRTCGSATTADQIGPWSRNSLPNTVVSPGPPRCCCRSRSTSTRRSSGSRQGRARQRAGKQRPPLSSRRARSVARSGPVARPAILTTGGRLRTPRRPNRSPALVISAGRRPARRPRALQGGLQLNTLRRIASRMAGPGWLGEVHPLLFAATRPLPVVAEPRRSPSPRTSPSRSCSWSASPRLSPSGSRSCSGCAPARP